MARLDSAGAGVSYGMYQVLHDTNNVTDSGCHCVSADHSSRVVGSVASSSELLFRAMGSVVASLMCRVNAYVFPGSLNSNTDIIIAMIVADAVKLTQLGLGDS